jgi:germination protein M
VNHVPARLVAVIFGIVLLAAACGLGGGDLGPVATPPPSEQPSLAIPSVEPTPGSTVGPSASPGSEPSSGPTPGTTGQPPETALPDGTTTVRAYFFLGSFVDNDGLAAVLRVIPKTQAVGAAAVAALLAGPSEAELAARPALYTVIPEGTRFLGLRIAGGIATVNLSAEFESGGGSASVLGRLAQVVYTLTQFPTITGVKFELDGAPVTVFSGEGVALDEPVDRSDYTEMLPSVFVDRPAWGGVPNNPMHLVGMANVFEATFQYRLLDAGGHTLAEGPQMASCGTGCWGTFDVLIPYSVDAAGWGTLQVWVSSAVDGSVEDLTEYPVWLTP